MEIKVTTEEGCAVMRLKGRFDFSAHRDFRAGIEVALQQAHARKIRVDMGEVDYLDSSALGMMLILRDKAQAANKTVEIANAKKNVVQVLEIANFKALFTIL